VKRVLVCGGREYNDTKRVNRAMREVQERYGIACVIEGGARGADYLAKLWAEGQGIPVIEMRANWNRYGKRAGHIRNGWMIEHGKPDLIVAFPGGRGTEDMCAQTSAAGLVLITPYAASAMSASGQDPQGLEAKPASAVPKADAQ
jgi:SLOG family YspA-like protein